MSRTSAVLSVVLCATGCAANSNYVPQHVARAELTLRYGGRMQMYAGTDPLTEGPTYEGLAEFVRCVPVARQHAELAHKDGRAGRVMAWLGGGLGVAGLGGLSGFAFLKRDRDLAFGLLGGGLAAAAVGIGLAAGSRGLRNSANGNAVDALNYYNDARGSLGGSCSDAAAPVPARVIVTPPPVRAPSPGRPEDLRPVEIPVDEPGTPPTPDLEPPAAESAEDAPSVAEPPTRASAPDLTLPPRSTTPTGPPTVL